MRQFAPIKLYHGCTELGSLFAPSVTPAVDAGASSVPAASLPPPNEQVKLLFGQRQRGGGASFRSADAAQVCNKVGFVVNDGPFECSLASAARPIVSERW